MSPGPARDRHLRVLSIGDVGDEINHSDVDLVPNVIRRSTARSARDCRYCERRADRAIHPMIGVRSSEDLLLLSPSVGTRSQIQVTTPDNLTIIPRAQLLW